MKTATTKSEPTVTLVIHGFPEKGLVGFKTYKSYWTRILFDLKLGRFNLTLTRGER